jgi:hypothetical protein
MKAARRTVATAILFSGLACGGGSGATRDAGTGGGSLDAASSSGGAGGGAAGAPAIPQCPATPPGATSCPKEGFKCYYDACPASGRAIATCTSGTWSVQTGACGPVGGTCTPYGKTCDSGQLCRLAVTGAFTPTCIANTCGAGPITFQCLTGFDPQFCVITGGTQEGFSLDCNYCSVITCE